MTTGRFVAFEGGEGSGKSTQLTLLAEALAAQGADVVQTREPGGSPRGERIRELILAQDSSDLDPRCEALLFAAARADHVAATVRPALNRGAIVLTDRYIDSSVAYQGQARALGEEWVRRISRWATQDLDPDLTIVLDIDPTVGLARAQDANRLEAEPMPFHRAVREAFLRYAQESPDRYVVISADRPPQDVASDVRRAVASVLNPAVSS